MDNEIWSSLNSSLSRRALVRGGALAGAGLAAAALIGCGGGDENKPATGGGTAAATGTSSAAAQNLPGLKLPDGRFFPYNEPEKPGLVPKDGGTVRIATTWDVSTMDPTKSGSGGAITVPNTASDRLLGFKRGPEADPFKLELVPELAKSWESTPDGLTYTFKLRRA